jgi:membrane protease YdiL (CAAX protease family)
MEKNWNMLKPSSSASKLSSALPSLGTALGVIIPVIVGEYFFRHYVLFWMPTIGSLRVNDMIALFLVYFLLLAGIGILMKTNWQQELAGIWHAAQENVRSWNFLLWFLILVASLAILPFLDKLLWGKFSLPMLLSPYQNPAVWLKDFAPFVKAVSINLVNGIFLPIAEEYLWRGIAQDRLLRILPAWLAIGITAVVFSFKHVLVDASWGRFLTLTAFGIICGIVARQKSWRSSATLHILINTITTVMGLILGLL